MEMVYKMDVGVMIKKVEVDIEFLDDYGILFNKLLLVGRDLLKENLMSVLNKMY